ncbi:hypothetical protein EPO66_04800 [bacterium]|nr:MAG: hypothetical protein EPO66_04800 [bacterium]
MKDLGLKVSATIFFIVGIMHILRLVLRYYVTMGVFVIPFWVSAVGAIFALSLSCWLFSLSKRRIDEKK